VLVVAWVRSIAAYLFLIAYVLVVGVPALLVALATGWARHLIVLGRLAAKVMRLTFGIGVDIDGLCHVVADRPTVYVINHRSNVDVIVYEFLLPVCPRLKAIYKAELGRLPVIGRVLRAAGFVPVERRDRERAIEAVDAAVDCLRAGDSFLLAPEGTRSRTGELLPFKKGGFVMAIKAQAPVVPIAITGSERAMPPGRFYATPDRVTIRIGEPVPTTGLTIDDRDRLAALVREKMLQLLH